MDEGARPVQGRLVLRCPEARARAFAAHDLRGGALPEHLRMLGTRHRDVPDPRRHVHTCVPLLLRALGQARGAAGPARAAAARGAGHYAATIRALKQKLPEASVEVLTPDFLGVEEEALQTVLAARPEVFNHNIETVRRLHARMRGAKASYDGALWLLRRAKELADYPVLTKSGIIVGLGETNDE